MSVDIAQIRLPIDQPVLFPDILSPARVEDLPEEIGVLVSSHPQFTWMACVFESIAQLTTRVIDNISTAQRICFVVPNKGKFQTDDYHNIPHSDAAARVSAQELHRTLSLLPEEIRTHLRITQEAISFYTILIYYLAKIHDYEPRGARFTTPPFSKPLGEKTIPVLFDPSGRILLHNRRTEGEHGEFLHSQTYNCQEDPEEKLIPPELFSALCFLAILQKYNKQGILGSKENVLIAINTVLGGTFVTFSEKYVFTPIFRHLISNGSLKDPGDPANKQAEPIDPRSTNLLLALMMQAISDADIGPARRPLRDFEEGFVGRSAALHFERVTRNSPRLYRLISSYENPGQVIDNVSNEEHVVLGRLTILSALVESLLCHVNTQDNYLDGRALAGKEEDACFRRILPLKEYLDGKPMVVQGRKNEMNIFREELKGIHAHFNTATPLEEILDKVLHILLTRGIIKQIG